MRASSNRSVNPMFSSDSTKVKQSSLSVTPMHASFRSPDILGVSCAPGRVNAIVGIQHNVTENQPDQWALQLEQGPWEVLTADERMPEVAEALTSMFKAYDPINGGARIFKTLIMDWPRRSGPVERLKELLRPLRMGDHGVNVVPLHVVTGRKTDEDHAATQTDLGLQPGETPGVQNVHTARGRPGDVGAASTAAIT